MLSIAALQEFGTNTAEGVGRCFGNEEFYLNLVKTVPAETRFDELADAIEKGDLDAAFEHAHALKGVLTNLSLTPISEPVVEMTELLRVRKQMDYQPLMTQILEKRDMLKTLCEG